MIRNTRAAVWLIVIASAARLALAATIPLFPDEAYYWEWSRHLAAGYFDHPAAIALLIRTGTTIFGATPLGVRFATVLAGVVASFALVITAWRLRDDTDRDVSLDSDSGAFAADPGTRAALLMLAIPGALVGFVLATPDAPLLAAIALTLAAVERAIASSPRSRETFGWWCAAGVTLGIAFCSKYTSVLIPAGVFIALLSRRDLRTRLAAPGPYAAAVIALVILTPTLLWNANNGWISFAFQLHHGLGQTRGSLIGREVAMLGGQLGIISPIIAVMAALAVARALRSTSDSRRYVLAVVATTVIVFFAVSATRRPVEPNWPVPALVAALPLLATMRLGRRGERWLLGGLILGVVCTLVVVVQAATHIIGVAARRDPISKAYGWTDLATAVQRAQTATHGCSALWMAADRYQDAAELAFTLPAHPRVFALNLGGRANQYDLWPSLYSLAKPSDCAIVTVDQGAGGEAVVQRIGADSVARVGDALMTWRSSPVGRRTIWLVRGIPSAPLALVALSPVASTALSATAAAFKPHAAILDSIVAVYRLGPVPDSVTLTSAAPIANADRRATIAARLVTLHALLQRSGFKAVYRDARYRDCTFVRSSEPDSTDVGYVRAPQGCRLATGHGDALLRVLRAQGDAQSDWYSYASPAHHHY